jgi:hypothetical protein
MTLDVGTGRVSNYVLQEEKTPKVIGTPATTPTGHAPAAIWFRRRRNSFQSLLSYIPSNISTAIDAQAQLLAMTSQNGMTDIEVDMRTIGWLLKAFFGSHSVSGNSGAGFTHEFVPGTSEKTFQILEDKGGFSSAYYRKYQGMFPNRISMNMGLNDWVWASIGYLGLHEATGSNPGTPDPEPSDVCAGFNQVTYYIGTTGATTLAAMSQWTDIYDMRLDLTRPDAVADDIRSDGTGESASIFPGTFTPSINLMTRFASTHKLATYDARTPVSVGVKIDTGTDIVPAGQNYELDFIFPRCTIQSYSVDFHGTGQSVPVLGVFPEIDPTAGYSTKALLYNDWSDYASPT